METVNKNFNNGFVAAFQYAIKVILLVILLACVVSGDLEELCLCPTGLNFREKLFFELESDDLIIFWKETLLSAENDLLQALCVGICELMLTLEKFFWTTCRSSIKATQKRI